MHGGFGKALYEVPTSILHYLICHFLFFKAQPALVTFYKMSSLCRFVLFLVCYVRLIPPWSYIYVCLFCPDLQPAMFLWWVFTHSMNFFSRSCRFISRFSGSINSVTTGQLSFTVRHVTVGTPPSFLVTFLDDHLGNAPPPSVSSWQFGKNTQATHPSPYPLILRDNSERSLRQHMGIHQHWLVMRFSRNFKNVA